MPGVALDLLGAGNFVVTTGADAAVAAQEPPSGGIGRLRGEG
jgi:hypothetical protein